MLKRLFCSMVLACGMLSPPAFAKTEHDLYEDALRYTLFIRTETKRIDMRSIEPVGFWDKFLDTIWEDRTTQEAGRATGFVIKLNEKYFVLTNHHVVDVEDEGTLYYTWFHGDKRSHPVRRYSWDVVLDLALLEFVEKDFVPPGYATLGNSDTLKIGDGSTLHILGNPLNLKNYWSSGLLIKKNAYTPRDPMRRLALDISCNPGNSGSPLIAPDGTVMGLIQSISQSPRPLCFATPSNLIHAMLPKLLVGGDIPRGTLGLAVLTAQEFTAKELERLNIIDRTGVIVAGLVPGGPSEGAGLKQGDRIVAVENPKTSLKFYVDTAIDFIEGFHINFTGGETAMLHIQRASTSLTIAVQITKTLPPGVQIIIRPPQKAPKDK